VLGRKAVALVAALCTISQTRQCSRVTGSYSGRRNRPDGDVLNWGFVMFISFY
jgi:hypothetical protein